MCIPVEPTYQLIRTLERRPEFKALIKHVSITCSGHAWPVPVMRAATEADALIGAAEVRGYPNISALWHSLRSGLGDAMSAYLSLLLPKLEVLNVRGAEVCADVPSCVLDVLCSAALRPWWCGLHGFCQLSVLELTFQSFTDIPGALFTIPSLRKVCLGNVYFATAEPSRWTCRPYTSPVTELSLRVHEYGAPEMRTVLQSFAELREFRLDTLRVPVNVARMPSSIYPALETQKHSLERIAVLTYDCYSYKPLGAWPIPVMYPMPSLRDFIKLRGLALTDAALVGNGTNGFHHWHNEKTVTLQYLSKMFPPSLECFSHVTWGGDYHETFAGVDKQGTRDSRWPDIWSALAEKALFPSLRKVKQLYYTNNGGDWDLLHEIWPRHTGKRTDDTVS